METPNIIIITSCLASKYRDNVFTQEERYNQTVNTIDCINKYMHNTEILFIEASDCNPIYKDNIRQMCKYYIDISKENYTIQYCLDGHKSLGDTYITLKGVEYIKNNNINFNICYKISARYYPFVNFNYDVIDKYIPTFKDSWHAPGKNIMTCFYAIPFVFLDEYLKNIKNTFEFMKRRFDTPVEDYFPNLFKIKKLVLWNEKIGIHGIVAVDKNKNTEIW